MPPTPPGGRRPFRCYCSCIAAHDTRGGDATEQCSGMRWRLRRRRLRRRKQGGGQTRGAPLCLAALNRRARTPRSRGRAPPSSAWTSFLPSKTTSQGDGFLVSKSHFVYTTGIEPQPPRRKLPQTLRGFSGFEGRFQSSLALYVLPWNGAQGGWCRAAISGLPVSSGRSVSSGRKAAAAA